MIATSVTHLEDIIDRFLAHGSLTTSLVLSSPEKKKSIVNVDEVVQGDKH